MKPRKSTGMLLAAVAAVWGVVAWKILSNATDPQPLPVRQAVSASPLPTPQADTLYADYPDPFLKGMTAQPPAKPAVRPLPAAGRKSVREKVRIVHLGTVAAAGRCLHILALDERQCELAEGEAAEGFVLEGSDTDSLFLQKEGITYGVARCR